MKRILAIVVLVALSCGSAVAGPRKELIAAPVSITVQGQNQIPADQDGGAPVVVNGITETVTGTVRATFNGSGQGWYALIGGLPANMNTFYLASAPWQTPRTVPSPMVAMRAILHLKAHMLVPAMHHMKLVDVQCNEASPIVRKPLVLAPLGYLDSNGNVHGFRALQPRGFFMIVRPANLACARIARQWPSLFRVHWLPRYPITSEEKYPSSATTSCYLNPPHPNTPLCYLTAGNRLMFGVGTGVQINGEETSQFLNINVTFQDTSVGDDTGIPTQVP